MFAAFREFAGPSDPRMAAYPLMKSPQTTVILSVIYLLFIKVIGPKWMAPKKPYSLRGVMVVYNLCLVVINAWIFLNLFIRWWLTKYNWLCEPIDTSNNPDALYMVQVLWVFYVSKVVDYFDTVFFILRKKDTQINFLHVFHHSTVPITAWYGTVYGPGGYNTIFPLANTFVHIWMYLYYGLSAMGPGIQKYLWWKKHLTKLQMAQFILVTLYFCHVWLFAPKSCKVSSFLVCLSLGQAIVYFGLFLNFYLNSYKKKSQKTTA